MGYGTAAGEELDCYTADGEDDGDDGSSQKRELRHQGLRDDEKLPVHGRNNSSESMTTAAAGCITMASVWGFGAKASPARRRAHVIVEVMRRRQRSGEYGGADGDPGSSGGSARRRRA